MLPRPDEAPGGAGGSFPAFIHFALTAAQPKPGQPPSVLIELDPGKAAFDLDDPPATAPRLAEQLAILRAAGLTIL